MAFHYINNLHIQIVTIFITDLHECKHTHLLLNGIKQNTFYYLYNNVE